MDTIVQNVEYNTSMTLLTRVPFSIRKERGHLETTCKLSEFIGNYLYMSRGTYEIYNFKLFLRPLVVTERQHFAKALYKK